MPETDWLTGEMPQQMVARDQQHDQEAFSTWWILVIVLPVILYLALQTPRSKP